MGSLLDSYGLNEYGFETPSLTTVIENFKEDLKASFGQELLVTDDSVAGILASIFGVTMHDVYKLLEGIYSTHTLNGAEGIYLDDLLSRYGVVRKGKQKGTGTVLVETTAETDNDYYYDLNEVQFSASNGQDYQATASYRAKENVAAFKILSDEIIRGAYTFNIQDTSDNKIYRWDYSVVDDPDDDVKQVFLTSLLNFMNLHTNQENSSRSRIVDFSLYFGFNDKIELVGINQFTEMYFVTPFGTRYTAIPCIAINAGEYAVSIDEVLNINPEPPAGYVAIHNPNAFFSGSDVESDAAFRYRYQEEAFNAGKGTKDSVITALLNTNNVQAVRVYDNPTDQDIGDITKFSFMCVVYGGSGADITKTIYDYKPINVHTSGDTTIAVNTQDGETEDVSYTVAVITPVYVEVNYTAKTNIPLSTTEKNTIIESLQSLFLSYSIGDTIYHSQVLGATTSPIEFGRLTNVQSLIKKDGGILSTDDVELDYSEYGDLDSGNITFKQVLR